MYRTYFNFNTKKFSIAKVCKKCYNNKVNKLITKGKGGWNADETRKKQTRGGATGELRFSEWLKETRHPEQSEGSMKRFFGQSSQNDNVRHCAFTLAEVLITLAIIGVVAAMTIPTLTNNYQKKVMLVKLQKAYNTLSNAINLSSIENGSPEEWDWDDGEDILKEKLGKYMKVSKYYDASPDHAPLCHEKQVTSHNNGGYTYAWLDSVAISTPFSQNDNYSLTTNDGMCLGLNQYGTTTQNSRHFITVDINGSVTGPNMAGKDLFFFEIDNNSGLLYPVGHDIEDISSQENRNNCNKNALYGGQYCAAKIIRDGWQISDDYPF